MLMMTQMTSDYARAVPTMTIWPEGSNQGDTLSGSDRAHHQRFQVGDCLNGLYELRSVLGSGGMGQVFEAYDRSLRRMVAIKVAWAARGEAELENEGIALAALKGHGVPCIYGINTASNGARYYVMERVHGQTLANFLVMRACEKPLPLADVLDILIGIANVLSEIHSAGLIHCDLKPANIMLAPCNRIVLLDLGLFLSRGETGNSPESSAFRGSPYYVAPERITSSVAADSAHSLDLYALGIIGFLLLTGQHPFHASNLRLLLRQHLHALAPSLPALRSDVPWQLDRLIREMLAKDPANRPATAAAIAAELSSMRPS